MSTAPEQEELSPSQRHNGQKAAYRANLLSQGVAYVMTGALMMLYANDVLGLSASRISQVLAIIPLAALTRIFVLPWLRRVGFVRTLVVSDAVQLAVVVILLAIPSHLLSFPVYLVLLLVFSSATQLGGGTVWQPLMRDVTTVADRGRFFARMRFLFTSVGTVVTGVVPLLVGNAITEAQYKLLLVIPAISLVNHLVWVRTIPELPHAEPANTRPRLRDSFSAIRGSALLRRPLLIFIAVQFSLFPLLPVYLRQVVGLPSNIVSTYLFCVSLGSALSYVLFGRIADSMGFKPLLYGVLVIASVASPLYLLVTPLGDSFVGLAAAAWPERLSVVSLLAIGIITGSVSAGAGLGLTSIQHYFVSSRDSLESMNAFSSLTVIIVSVQSLAYGLLIDRIAVPLGNLPIIPGYLAADAVKIYLVVGATLFRVVALLAARGLPNLRAQFGVADFFSALSPASIRSMIIGRRTVSEDESARLVAARRIGLEATPLGVDPLLGMLEDPSYDVKVEATRALATTGSEIAGNRLLEELERDELGVIADHIAWSLGELRHAPATGALIERATNRELGPRMRSAAARALGKIRDVAAVAPLEEVVANEEREIIRSAAMIALVQIGRESGIAATLGYIHEIRGALTERELLFHLCRHFDLPIGWLLMLPRGTHARAALLNYVETRPVGWQSARRKLIDAIRARDHDAVRGLAADALEAAGSPHAKSGRGPVDDADARILLSAADQLREWSPLAKLVALQLLELGGSGTR